MVSAVKAVLPHIASTDQNLLHQHCSPEHCDYIKNPEKYKHRHCLPSAVVSFIQLVFDDLADESLLRKCTHGKTQNVNECLNKIIWDRCSKEFFVEKTIIEDAVYCAVAHFNEGAKSVLDLQIALGLSMGYFSHKMCQLKDEMRIKLSISRSSDSAKKGERL